ncbi:hypothetical protein FOH10_09070 [Nocardia otitidiscaviarum]|uniref:Uncharacterized protein n=1 Tax=Nocardia otitidiscaviarum TaxID=1823 RepID=A0A516NIX9_9NOCA|nr:hypothetical protein [Nocardia otitidiscaviarum]MCP9619694.1 hypothetical protein [Nocardia otitidiscaviarum]QDP78864.1 hypothetical protein FOH10_09070 [Nocardia otitidiscaviarum]
MCDRAAALRELYDVFARVPRPDVIDGCPHCVAPDEGRRLLDEPIRSLTPEALARYAAKAMSTWGGVDDFRYLLPRLLELAAGREWRSSYWSGAAAGRLDAWLERLGLG